MWRGRPEPSVRYEVSNGPRRGSGGVTQYVYPAETGSVPPTVAGISAEEVLPLDTSCVVPCARSPSRDGVTTAESGRHRHEDHRSETSNYTNVPASDCVQVLRL